MKTKKFMSNLLAVLAMLAVCMTAVSLTACSDDDDDNKDKSEGTVSIYKQWELETSPEPARFLYAIYDFTEQGKVKALGKYTAEFAAANGLSADRYYVLMDSNCTITMGEDGKSGTIKLADETIWTFSNLTATSVTITSGGVDYVCKPTAKKIVAE